MRLRERCSYRGASAPGKPSISELGGARSTPSGMLRKPGLGAGLTGVPVLPDDLVGLRVDDDHAVVVVVVGEDVAVGSGIASDGWSRAFAPFGANRHSSRPLVLKVSIAPGEV